MNPFNSELAKNSNASLKSLEQNDKSIDNTTDGVLYEDEFCKLTNTEIEIKRYFASIESKIIPLERIEKVYYGQQRKFPGKEAWTLNDDGLSVLGKIWWAHDQTRQMFNSGEHYNVVLDTGSEHKKGFTVVDINTFGYYLYELTTPKAVFYDGLPEEHVSMENPPLFHKNVIL